MKANPWTFSFLLHGLLVGAFALLSVIQSHWSWKREPEMIEVPISDVRETESIQKVEDKPQVVLKSVNPTAPAPTAAKPRAVFGISRNAHTEEGSGAGIEAKLGNTVAKAQDSEQLKASDADSLPSPTEDYLVSEMPSVLSEVKPDYPAEAKAQGLTGSVVLSVLIDREGKVRQVGFLEGPKAFQASAEKAMLGFKFRPAKVDGQAVAVRIRYTIHFKLDY